MCTDISLATLVCSAQSLHFAGDPVYGDLWLHFLVEVVQHRVAPYFTDLLTDPTTARQPSAKPVITCDSLCAHLVQYLEALTVQETSTSSLRTHPGIWADLRAVRALLKLVEQFAFFDGENTLEVEDNTDLEDLEKACANFRKKTSSIEVIMTSLFWFCLFACLFVCVIYLPGYLVLFCPCLVIS